MSGQYVSQTISAFTQKNEMGRVEEKEKKNTGEKIQIFDSKGFCFSLAGQMIGNCVCVVVVVHVFLIASSGLSVRPS